MDRTLGIADARKNFSTIIEQVQYRGQSFLVCRHGRPAAAIVPVEVYDAWVRQREQLFGLVRRTQSDAGLPDATAARIASDAVASARGR